MNKRTEKKQDIFFSDEQAKMRAIKSEDQYNNELNRWKKIKNILDEIYKLTPPFGEVQKISKKSASIFSSKEQVKLFQKNRGIKIYLDPNKFSLEIQLFFKPALKFLLNMGVIAYTDYEYGGIVTTQPYRKFLEGNILIRNKANFEKFYEKFMQFYNFININKAVKESELEANEKTKTIYNNKRSWPIGILSTSTIDITPKMDIKHPTLAGISRDSQRGMGEIAKRHHAEEMQRRQFKNQRILNSKEDKKIHALNTIIERTEPCYPSQKDVSIDYYHFNYEDRVDDGKLLANFLDIAKNKGCFNGFTTTNDFRKTIINFIEIDLNKTKKYRDELLEQQNNLNTKKRKETDDLSNTRYANNPSAFIKNGQGYFRFNRTSKHILIGKKNTRHFRLLQCLCSPNFGIQKTMDGIFESIRLEKDNNSTELRDYSPQCKNKKWDLITYAKKELQKNKQLQGKIKFCSNKHKDMWLEME